MACNKNQKPEELQEEQLEEVSGGHSRGDASTYKPST